MLKGDIEFTFCFLKAAICLSGVFVQGACAECYVWAWHSMPRATVSMKTFVMLGLFPGDFLQGACPGAFSYVGLCLGWGFYIKELSRKRPLSRQIFTVGFCLGPLSYVAFVWVGALVPRTAF